MAIIRVRHRSIYEGLRHRILNVLSSNAARKINFRLDGIHVVGFEVGRILSHLLLNPRGQLPLRIRTGMVSDGAGAEYDQTMNRFEFPNEDFGQTADERASIFHECVHAWRDAGGRVGRSQADVARGLLWRATKATDEAAAYVAEVLFLYHDAGPGELGSSVQGVYREAERIALNIANRPGVLIPAENIAALKREIMAQPLYWDIAAFPDDPYNYDGI